MPSQGPLLPGTAATLANAGTSENAEAWVNPGNITADDGTQATITAPTYDSPDISQLLIGSNYGFTLPSGAIVYGIVVEVDRSNAAGAASDNRVQLAKGTTFADLVGNNLGDLATDWPTAQAAVSYGSSTNLWGATWTWEEINASSFAVFLSAQADAANTDVGVDFYKVTVHYADPPTHIRGQGQTFPPGRKMPRKPLTEAMGEVAAQTFNQALDASVATVATMTRSVGKILTDAVATTATIVKQVGKAVTASTVSTTATIVKQVGKTVTASVVATVASLTAAKVINVALTATVATTATMVRQVGKIVTAAVATTASITKQVTKTLSATVATVASLTAIKVIIVNITATVGTAATMTRQVGKTVSSSVATSASMVRQVAKSLTATVATTATMMRVKTAVATLTVTVGTTATMTRQIAKTVTASVVGTTATITKQVGKTLTATVSTVASLVADFISGVIAFTLGHFNEPTPAADRLDEPTPEASSLDEPTPGSDHFDEPTPS